MGKVEERKVSIVDPLIDLEQFEQENKQYVCDYFKTLNENLDPYLKNKEKYSIVYSWPSTSNAPVTSAVKKEVPLPIIINHNPHGSPQKLPKQLSVQTITRKKCIIIDDTVRSLRATLYKM